MRLALGLLATALCAQQGQPQLDAAAAARGAAQFKSSCGFCHGDDATGNRAPDLIRSVSLNHDKDGEVLGPVIRNGRPDLGMPAFSSLSARQIEDIVVFLHSQALAALRSNGVPRDYPLAKLLTGNAVAGKTYFNGAGACSGCHSATGDLAGIARKYSPLDLQQRMLYPGGPSKVTATVTPPDGRSIQGAVVANDEFDIAITGPDGWFRSWPKTAVKVELHDPLAVHRSMAERYTDADVHNLFAYLETLK
jgi:cytochrome c oxidase cbb3-type subunit 3